MSDIEGISSEECADFTAMVTATVATAAAVTVIGLSAVAINRQKFLRFHSHH